MDKEFVAMIQAAAVAGWWTVLIAAIWITIAWLVWRGVIKSKPAWLMRLWGFDLEWQEVQRIMFYSIAIMKMSLFVCILICIWLTLWV